MGKAWIGNFKGPKGDPGNEGQKGEKGTTGTRGSRWFNGVGITGTETTDTVFNGSGVGDVLEDDYYLNTETGNTYRCTKGGSEGEATWVWCGNIKGPQGEMSNLDEALSATSKNGITNAAVTKALGDKLGTNGDGSSLTEKFSVASTLTNIVSGESHKTIFGKIMKVIAEYITHKDTAGTNAVLGHLKLGTAEGTACAGNDSRLSDERTPKSHNQSASTITEGTLGGKVKANATAMADLGAAQVRDIYFGETELEDGVSTLPAGVMYFKFKQKD